MSVRFDRVERFLDSLWYLLPFTNNLATSIKLNPSIGIVILVHERPEYLELCLDSLFTTNLHEYDVTFLIQDDGSSDSRVREIMEQTRNSQYKIFRSYSKKGHDSWGAAFNKAMRKLLELGNFDIVGSCDSDAYFHPEWLDSMMKVALWAKKYHKQHILGPFSCFNSSDYNFHRILGTYNSPAGKYVVKERMGGLVYFYFKTDFQNLGYFEESRDDETLMTRKMSRRRVRNFCTEISYVEHLGRESVLDAWRPKVVGNNAAFGVKLAREGWNIPSAPTSYIPKKRLSNDLVIHIKYSGLGDHLFYSHLPRIAKETGRYRNVFISEASPFRNLEIRRLVWELNPYIDGFCNEICPYPNLIHRVSPECNLLDQLMLCHDLDDGERHHEPEIYYKPQILENLAGKAVYDPNFISNAGSLSAKKVEKYFYSNNVKIDYQMKLREKCLPINNNLASLSSSSIEEFCDIINSCTDLYCLVTGTATLASALGKSATVLYGSGVSNFFMHSKLHTYKKI
ncbi:MAG: glycosyltransferase [Desulfuromonadaceae bacterium]|nr:glycosyltransferase [Desulfuromonadaceae bacterium]